MGGLLFHTDAGLDEGQLSWEDFVVYILLVRGLWKRHGGALLWEECLRAYLPAATGPIRKDFSSGHL